MDERLCEPLVNQELFEWHGMRGIRMLGHLLIYWGADAMPVCVVGNFDGPQRSAPSGIPEILATRIAERLDRDTFRLSTWDPRESKHPFCEITLSRTKPTESHQGRLVILDSADGGAVAQHGDSATVQLANPQWSRRTEDEMAKLLGEAAIR